MVFTILALNLSIKNNKINISCIKNNKDFDDGFAICAGLNIFSININCCEQIKFKTLPPI